MTYLTTQDLMEDDSKVDEVSNTQNPTKETTKAIEMHKRYGSRKERRTNLWQLTLYVAKQN